MRKLLLVSAAMLSATAGIAMAQNPSQGQLAAPWASGPAVNNNNNSAAAVTKGVGPDPNPGHRRQPAEIPCGTQSRC
jgi:hypothetical protein